MREYMNECFICGAKYVPGREYTCSEECHEKLKEKIITEFGEFKKIVRASTGEVFKVPTIDIIEKGIREQELDQYPRWVEADVEI